MRKVNLYTIIEKNEIAGGNTMKKLVLSSILTMAMLLFAFAGTVGAEPPLPIINGTSYSLAMEPPLPIINGGSSTLTKEPPLPIINGGSTTTSTMEPPLPIIN